MGKSTVKEFAGKAVVIRYDAQRCIHAAECVRGAPAVFDPKARPWIDPDRGEVQQLVEVVNRCPTGALTLRLADGTDPETADATNSAAITADGPIHLRGRIVHGGERCTRAALCRCGASANKPFCDGSHTRVGFADAGRFARPPEPVAHAADGELVLNPIPNGPLRIDGYFELRASDGAAAICGDKTWLCRCGHSGHKPFCDGTHKKIGFTA